MGPVLNALALIGIVIVTAIILCRYGRKPVRPFYAVMGSVFYFIVCSFLLLTFFHTRSYDGSWTSCWPLERLNRGLSVPIYQILIILSCMSLLLIFLQTSTIKIYVFICCVLMIFITGKHFFMVTNGSSKYTYSPGLINDISYARTVSIYKKMSIESIENLTQYYIHEKSIVLHAGWINDIGIEKILPKQDFIIFSSQINQYEKWLEQYDVKTEWYTPITGIYRIQPVPVGFWYPGGRIKDNM